ncbi:hypothetical protein Lal_00042306 [Lupinus albus]|nr:hypothetical protein Lal_00042306 [Lupinus albus]
MCIGNDLTTKDVSSLSLRSILADGKLVGDNFHDWYRTLRIVLMHEKLINTIDKVVIPEPKNNDDVEAVSAYKKYLDDLMSIKCLILASTSSELQRQHEDMDPTGIIALLKKMYDAQSRTVRYKLSKTLFRSTLSMNAQVGPHVINMISLMEQLEKLGCKLGKELIQYLILQPLPESFSQFIIDSGKDQGSVLVVGKFNNKHGKWNNKSNKKPFVPKCGLTKYRDKKSGVDQINQNVSSIRRRDIVK